MTVSKRSRLLALAERCEQAQGPQDLSWLIAEALGWTKYWSAVHAYLPPGATEESGPWCDRPKFTESVDAALTLVPEGANVELSTASHRKGWRADVWFAEVCTTDADTPALALCAAALKALASQEPDDDRK